MLWERIVFKIDVNFAPSLPSAPQWRHPRKHNTRFLRCVDDAKTRIREMSAAQLRARHNVESRNFEGGGGVNPIVIGVVVLVVVAGEK